jgi:arylformamidase
MTPETAERGYNNRAAVPEHPQYFARWAAESARVRSALHCSVDVRYGARPKETIDVFPRGRRRGLLFFIHGGYWRSLDKSEHSFVAEPFVEHGFDVAVINYDLARRSTSRRSPTSAAAR